MTKDSLGFLFSSALGLLLSVAFVFVAPLPIRYFRLSYGRAPFVLIGLSLTIFLIGMGQWQWALSYFAINILIGVYSEMELRGVSLFTSSVASVCAAGAATAAGLSSIARKSDVSLWSYLEKQLEPFYTQFSSIPSMANVSPETLNLVAYVPSALTIGFMLMLFVTLSVFTDEVGQSASKGLKDFRLPDPCIWLFIGSFAGAFLLQENSLWYLVARNALFVMIAAYFFQGLAVVSTFLNAYRISSFWRLLIFFFIFVQAFVLVAGVGVLDFWFDFRERFKLKIKKLNSNRQEKL